MYPHYAQITLRTCLTPGATSTPTLLLLRTQPPVILTSKLVMQRLDPLRPLPLAQFICRRNLEKRGRRLNQPLRLDGADNVHVLLRRLDQTLIDNVFGRLAKQRRGRMQEHRRAFDKRFVAF